MIAQLYTYTWGNNERRATMKGRTCEIVQRQNLNSAVIRFVDNGQLEVVSRNSLRKVKP